MRNTRSSYLNDDSVSCKDDKKESVLSYECADILLCWVMTVCRY